MRKNLKPVGVILFTIGIISGWTATAFANIPHLQITQQASSCKGTVKDVMGEPIIGASVMVEGTTNGVITDLDGNFSLSNVQKGASIIISYIGYGTQTIKWDGQPLSITLKEDTYLED